MAHIPYIRSARDNDNRVSVRGVFVVGILLPAVLIGLVGCLEEDGPIDNDGDGLIDIFFLEQLDNIRLDLDGTHYRNGTTARQCGGGGDTGNIDCVGYELMRSLDFADPESYALGTVKSDWRPNNDNPGDANNAGWTPIEEGFATVFEGNGNTISNLYSRGNGSVGLFAALTSEAVIRNLGVVAGHLYGGDGRDNIGGLVGRQSDGVIIASYATGDSDGGNGDDDNVGGLVGRQSDGFITASYATGDIDGGDGDGDDVGDIVGDQQGGGNDSNYGFGTQTNGEFISMTFRPTKINNARELTEDSADSSWNRASSSTLSAWDFGTDREPPALRYADYDGTHGTMYACDSPPPLPPDAIIIPNCGELLPGQRGR